MGSAHFRLHLAPTGCFAIHMLASVSYLHIFHYMWHCTVKVVPLTSGYYH